MAGSTALGAGLISANLLAIEWIAERYFRPGVDRSSAGGLIILKLAAMVLILYAIVRYVPVHLPAFIGGFAAFVLASVWEGIAAPKTPAAGPEVNKP